MPAWIKVGALQNWWVRRPATSTAAALALWVCLQHWRLVLNGELLATYDTYTSDFLNGEFPMRVEMGRLLREGEWATWTDRVFAGYQFHMSDPLSLLCFTFLPPVAAVNVCLLVTLWWGALGTTLFSRTLDVSWRSAWLAGALWTSSGFVVCQMRHIGILEATCWVPWCFIGLHRLLVSESRRETLRACCWLAGSWGLLLLAGFPQCGYYTALGMLLYAMPTLFRELRARNIRRPAVTVLAGMIVGIYGAVLATSELWPMWSISQHSPHGAGMRWEYLITGSFEWQSLRTMLSPVVDGKFWHGSYLPDAARPEDFMYFGVFALLLALGAGLSAWRRSTPQSSFARTIFVGAVLACFVAFGHRTPVWRTLHAYFPGFALFRLPQRIFCLVVFLEAVLAAQGFDKITKYAAVRWPTSRLARSPLLWILLVAIDPALLNSVQNSSVDGDRWFEPPAVVARLRREPHRITYSPYTTQVHRAAYEVSEGLVPAPYLTMRSLMQPDINLLWGVRTLGGHAGTTIGWSFGFSQVGMLLDNVWSMALTGVDVHGREGLTSMSHVVKLAASQGVDFVVIAHNQPELQRLARRHTQEGTVHVYELANVPDAYLATQASVVATDVDFESHPEAPITADAFHLGRSVVLYEPLARVQAIVRAEAHLSRPGALTPGRAIEWLERRPSYRRWHVRSRGQWLVDVDTFTFDWQATIDGEPVPMARANLRQRAVFVPPGEHTVEMRLVPTAVYRGRMVSAFAAVLLLVVSYFAYRRTSR